jgi:hypothetical protein
MTISLVPLYFIILKKLDGIKKTVFSFQLLGTIKKTSKFRKPEGILRVDVDDLAARVSIVPWQL